MSNITISGRPGELEAIKEYCENQFGSVSSFMVRCALDVIEENREEEERQEALSSKETKDERIKRLMRD